MTVANEKQVGGNHYKGKGACRSCGASLEVWDLAHIFKWDGFQFSIIKYVMRWKDKHGIEDLEKAQHFIAKLLELAREDYKRATQWLDPKDHPTLPTSWSEIAPGVILELDKEKDASSTQIRYADEDLSAIKLAGQFHRTFKLKVASSPNIKDDKLNKLRLDLIEEELRELAAALEDEDLTEVLDALVDLEYVIAGAYLSFGLHVVRNAALREVQRSNMTKLFDGEPRYAESGKILKGPNFEPPRLKELLERAELL